ncbi:hypothetical protein NIES4101_58210 [Calothrix sp. NIES-4101]|nr:hypothetical protein NIES4101_58210 [Calothrix sp. NIES-4101]
MLNKVRFSDLIDSIVFKIVKVKAMRSIFVKLIAKQVKNEDIASEVLHKDT